MYEPSLLVFALCVPAACVAGFINSIAGGGGIICVSTMLLAGVPPHLALGTNKLQAAVGTGYSMYLFARRGFVNWRLSLIGVPSALIGSAIGSRFAVYLPADLLGKLLVFFLPPIAVICLLPKKEKKGDAVPFESFRFRVVTPLVCLGLGLFDGVIGQGIGTLFILAFHWLLGRTLLECSGTSKVLNEMTNIGALAIFLLNGKVLFALGLPMVLASLAGNAVGARLAMRIGDRIVRIFLTVALGLLFVSLFFRYFPG